MITLYGFGAGFGLPEISPFVTKTEVQLKMAGLAYRKEKAMPPASPKGQLPYIEDEAETHRRIPPSSARISRANTASISTRRSVCRQRAQAWAFERMIEHHVYWALVGARWVDPENFAKGPAHFFDARARASARKAARGRAIPRRRELSVERPRPPCPGRGRRPCGPLAVCAVGPAWRQALSDGRDALRHRCHRLRRAGRDPDALSSPRRCASGPSISEISPPMSTA